MFTYETLTPTNRTILAITLLVLFMALIMADLFLSFFGGLVLGLLMAQLGMEARMYLARRKNSASDPNL